MALLNQQPRQADVVALGYCRVLVLSDAELRRFLRDYPDAKAHFDAVAEKRRRENAARATPANP